MNTETLIINNFAGRLTRYVNGDVNSGFAKYASSYGYDPFSKPGNLTWMEQPVEITNPDGVGTGGLCVAAKPRLDPNTSVLSVYAVFDNTRVSKIQVIDTATKNPNYDYASSIATLTAGSPSFQYGTSIQFFGASVLSASASEERVFIGHDKGITKIDLTGANETSVAGIGNSSVMGYVPRPSANFLGKTYWGNGNNIMEVDSTETVINYARLNPGFPKGTYVRDLDVTPDGNYLQIIVSRINSSKLTTIDQDVTSLASTDSYKFLWNGTDPTYTAYETYNGYTINSNMIFGQNNYTVGYDLDGAALYSGSQKVASLPNSISPNFGAMFNTGNLVGFASPEYVSSVTSLQASLMVYGQYDEQQPAGLYRLLRAAASATNNDVSQLPMCIPVSNLFHAQNRSTYANNIVGAAKLYFSTLDSKTGSSDITYKFYRFTTVPTGTGSVLGGVYETQTQLFGKKIDVSQARIYAKPWVANNQFKIELIGSDGNPIPNSDYTFGVGLSSGTRQGPLVSGSDYAWYSPNCAPTYALGLRITNQGSANITIYKVEIDYGIGGK